MKFLEFILLFMIHTNSCDIVLNKIYVKCMLVLSRGRYISNTDPLHIIRFIIVRFLVQFFISKCDNALILFADFIKLSGYRI
ncbi:hypothetical protein C2G38_2059221 [Gigaspora rosea]|uniref:Uncharacterized protein n=1 Tax=Gigaspora rosea TaxID=44941 RepID=A0A397W166_9GLOM|nr:hypothetical protein C2G38_2059221 [Gigaspora rosea]